MRDRIGKIIKGNKTGEFTVLLEKGITEYTYIDAYLSPRQYGKTYIQELMIMKKYQTKSISYDNCNPTVADHLVKGQKIFCQLWTIDRDKSIKAYVIAWSIKTNKYITEDGDMFQYAQPIIQDTQRVITIDELAKFVRDHNLTFRSDGGFIVRGHDDFRPEFFQFLGKSYSTCPFVLPEWMVKPC